MKNILRSLSISIPFFMLMYSNELPKTHYYAVLYGIVIGLCLEIGYRTWTNKNNDNND